MGLAYPPLKKEEPSRYEYVARWLGERLVMGSQVTTRPPTRSPTLRERNIQDNLVESSTVKETQSIGLVEAAQEEVWAARTEDSAVHS